MIIELVRKNKHTYELTKFYREAGDPPGSGKKALCEMLSKLPEGVNTISLEASGGADEQNTRSKWLRWFIKDKRTFGTWSMAQLDNWMTEHKVPASFRDYVKSQRISEARKWTRVLASNEKLVKYYMKLGFAPIKNNLMPVVEMKGSIKKILTNCK